MKIKVEQEYTSVACNRTPEIVDWNNEGIICFGAKNAVVIYDTNQKSKDPLTVLSHHKSQVNSVKWLYKHNTCTELVSCSADKTAAIWSWDDGWKVTSCLTGHGDGVTSVYGIYDGDDLIVFTASIDSSVRVWERKGGTVTLKQKICLQSGLCLTLHAHMLSGNKPLLFCALDDHKIHVFAGEDYHRVNTLIGHEDWVRGLDVLDIDSSTILLASASQDTYIRLWRIQEHVEKPTTGIKVEERVFPAYGKPWSVNLEAVLSGHEGWVYGVQWHPYSYENGVKKPVYRLLSSSLDKTLIIWEPESSPTREGEGVWTEHVRVGEVGGNGLGFYGSRFGPGGTYFMGHGYNGSFHIWGHCKETGQWEPAVVVGGHYSTVEDLAWEPHRGRYLMSVSADQTSRLHALWSKRDGPSQWHEIARPQVHGYDMASLALITSTTYASAAEEKVIRVFTAPHNFITNFKNIVGEDLVKDGVGGPEGASVPSLGLSNKAVFTGEDKPDSNDDNDGYFVPVDMTEPPKEETLVQHTLWPEAHKLYGHGYEVFALAASPDAALLASACKATTADHAAILIWETSTWHQVQKLTSHQLTVTQMAFSPDSTHLLSVSRDRRWSLFRRRQGSNSFDMVSSTDKTNGVHSRIIWCCAWAHDSSAFATGSRDGKVCVWTKKEMKPQSSLGMYGLLGEALSLPNTSVTAVAFAPLKVLSERILAAGFESGVIRIYSLGDSWRLLHELDNSAAHHLSVKRLAFRPVCESDSELLLASCGSDHFVRIHRITLC